MFNFEEKRIFRCLPHCTATVWVFSIQAPLLLSQTKILWHDPKMMLIQVLDENSDDFTRATFSKSVVCCFWTSSYQIPCPLMSVLFLEVSKENNKWEKDTSFPTPRLHPLLLFLIYKKILFSWTWQTIQTSLILRRYFQRDSLKPEIERKWQLCRRNRWQKIPILKPL